MAEIYQLPDATGNMGGIPFSIPIGGNGGGLFGNGNNTIGELIDLDEVDSWLFAIDMLPKERNDACRQILSYGWYSVCNIDHKVEVDVKAR